MDRATFVRKATGNEDGSAGILFALLAMPLIALLGMAVEYGRVINSHESMQLAIDAAVLAGRNAPDEDKVAVAQKYFKANLKKVIADATAEFRVNSDGDIEGEAVAKVETPLAGLAQNGAVEVRVFALARPDRDEDVVAEEGAGDTPCFHVMDQSGAGTFTLDSNSNFDARNCQVRVRSNHASAMYETSSSNVRFRKVLVKGGASINSGYSAEALYIYDGNHQVTEQAQVVGNPYDAAVGSISRAMPVGNCTTANTNKTLSGAVSPGTYCGLTEFKNATLGPGVYVIKSGTGGKDGALKLSGNINGSSGVTFYLADNKARFLSYSASEGSVLKAPTIGLTRGVLFMENSNRGQNYGLQIGSVDKQSWTGLVYLPSVNLELNSISEWPVFNVAIASNQLKLKSVSGVLQPFSWTPYNYDQPITLVGERQISRREGWLLE